MERFSVLFRHDEEESDAHQNAQLERGLLAGSCLVQQPTSGRMLMFLYPIIKCLVAKE